MLIITKENNSIKVVGQNNPTYPYSGTLVYPLNSVTVVTDQSDMAVFRSALNNDVLFTGLIDNITIAGSAVTKEDIGTKFGAIANSSGSGGGGTGGGAVDSVNGQTGTVVLTAADVNAYSKAETDEKLRDYTPLEAYATEIASIKKNMGNKADKSSLDNYLLKTDAQSTYETISGAQGKYQAKLTAGTGIEITGENVINVTLDTNIYQVVETLPESEINPNKIYLVLNSESGESDLYTEYLYVNNKWEKIGEYKADVDLTPYLKSSEAASTYATKQELAGEVSEREKQDSALGGMIAGETEAREQAINNLTTTVQGKLDTATYNSEKATFETKENAAATYQPKGSYLTSIPDEYVTDTELTGKGYATEAWVTEQGYLTEHQDISGLATKEELNGKQDTLVSGTNIKTVNGNSLLGSGDITIEGGGTSGAEVYDFEGSSICSELTFDVAKEGVILQNVTLSGMDITTNGVLTTLAKFDNSSAVGFALLSEGKYNGTNKPFLAQVLITNVGGATVTRYTFEQPSGATTWDYSQLVSDSPTRSNFVENGKVGDIITNITYEGYGKTDAVLSTKSATANTWGLYAVNYLNPIFFVMTVTASSTAISLAFDLNKNIVIDNELNSTSENPVQNKVISAELNKKVNLVNADLATYENVLQPGDKVRNIPGYESTMMSLVVSMNTITSVNVFGVDSGGKQHLITLDWDNAGTGLWTVSGEIEISQPSGGSGIATWDYAQLQSDQEYRTNFLSNVKVSDDLTNLGGSDNPEHASILTIDGNVYTVMYNVGGNPKVASINIQESVATITNIDAIPKNVATITENGLMSSADKTKLDSIDIQSILSRLTALETQMGEVSAKLDAINGETV